MIKEIVEATIKECYPKFVSVTTLPSDFETQVLNEVREQVKNLNIPTVSNRRELLISYTLKMLSCTDEHAETMVDSYLSLYG